MSNPSSQPASAEGAAKPVLRYLGRTAESANPKVVSTFDVQERLDYVDVANVLKQAGDKPQVNLSFMNGVYEIDTAALRMMQQETKQAHDKLQRHLGSRLPLPPLRIAASRQIGPESQWDYDQPGAGRIEFIVMPTEFLKSLTMQDIPQQVQQGFLGPRLFSEMMAHEQAHFKPYQNLEATVDAIGAQATNDPCSFIQALESSTMAAAHKGAPPFALTPMMDRIDSMQHLAQKMKKNCNGRE